MCFFQKIGKSGKIFLILRAQTTRTTRTRNLQILRTQWRFGNLIKYPPKKSCIPIHVFFSESWQIWEKTMYRYTCVFSESCLICKKTMYRHTWRFWDLIKHLPKKSCIIIHVYFSETLLIWKKTMYIYTWRFGEVSANFLEAVMYRCTCFFGRCDQISKSSCIPIHVFFSRFPDKSHVI